LKALSAHLPKTGEKRALAMPGRENTNSSNIEALSADPPSFIIYRESTDSIVITEQLVGTNSTSFPTSGNVQLMPSIKGKSRGERVMAGGRCPNLL
jgi:hypothetical protein